MARLATNQRVVKSMKDNKGNAYTKTKAGGKGRAGSAVQYMDEGEKTQLYHLGDDGRAIWIHREEALERVRHTETNYQQHMAFTTLLPGHLYVMPKDERSTVEVLAQAIQARRPDAEIYALAVHTQPEGNIHVHVAFGTKTTLRRDDLPYLREASFQMEQHLKHEMEIGVMFSQRGQKIPLRNEISMEGVAAQQLDDQGAERWRSASEPLTLNLNDLRWDAPTREKQLQAEEKLQAQAQSEVQPQAQPQPQIQPQAQPQPQPEKPTQPEEDKPQKQRQRQRGYELGN